MIKNNSSKTLQIKAVIFDMDGVITNTMPDHFAAWKQVLFEEGIAVSHLDIYRREGQRGITSVHEIYAQYDRVLDDQMAKQILGKKEELFKKIVKRRFITGSRSFLKLLKARRIELALVTGTSRHELQRILPEELRNFFKVIVTGDDVVKGKPDPEPYLLGLKKLGISSKEAVVIENAPFGIASAKAAGIYCVAIATSLPHEFLKEADVIFDSIKALRGEVEFNAAGSK